MIEKVVKIIQIHNKRVGSKDIPSYNSENNNLKHRIFYDMTAQKRQTTNERDRFHQGERRISNDNTKHNKDTTRC